MLRHEAMRSNSQRPGKAVCVLFVTRVRYCCVDELRPGFREPHQDLGLSRINSADHTGVFAIDREFAIRKSVRQRYSLLEAFDGFSKFTGDEQRIS
jgi:hypothetical protein